ncbi:Rdx family protein [Leishmania donovani]|nr:Rdx family protein [Leishmania donovani]
MALILSPAPSSQRSGTNYARTVLLVLASLALVALLFGGGSEGSNYGNFISMVGHPRRSGMVLPAMATAVPSEAPSADGQHAGDVVDAAEPAECAMPEAGEAHPMNEQYDYKDEEEADAVVAATATGADASAKSPTAHLDGLSVEELTALLVEKKKGWVNLNRFKDREALVQAIFGMEQKEAAQIAFRAEVAAAARWYAEHQSQFKAAHHRPKGSRTRGDSAEPAAAGGSDVDEAQHEVLVLYNQANGYDSKFEVLRKELQESEAVSLPNLADFKIIGQAYPMSPRRVLISKALQGAFFGTLGLALMGDQLKFIPESVLAVLRARRGLITSTGFMLNVLSRAALQNNAFEVFLDGELIYSALNASGRVPTAELLSNLLLERTLLKDYYAAKKTARA